jgi:hypothetical protein
LETLFDFRSIVSEKQAYLLGYICADGSIHKNGCSMNFECAIKDRDFMEKIHSTFCPGAKFSTRIQTIKGKEYTSCFFSVYNPRIVKQLSGRGITNNKSLVISFPDLPSRLIRHFIRGYFDGDGSIFSAQSKYTCFGVLGTETFLAGLLGSWGYELNITPDRSVRRISTCGSKAIQFLSWIYSSSSIYCPRKYNTFQRLTGGRDGNCGDRS